MATKALKIDFKINPKVTYVSPDIPSYKDFQTYWADCHDGEEDEFPCPEEGSKEYWDEVNFQKQLEYDDFRGNFKYSSLIGKTCVFLGFYDSRYPDYRPSHGGGNVTKIESFNDFLKAFAGSNPDDVTIWQDKEGLHVQNAHHDGTSTSLVKTLTKKGEQYWNRKLNADEASYKDIKYLAETKGMSSNIDYYLF